MIYSWSRLNAFNRALNGEGCLYEWYKTYIEEDRGETNFFSEYGNIAHKLLKDFNDGILTQKEVIENLEIELSSMKYGTFPNIYFSYEKKIKDFFSNLEFNLKDHTFLENEKEVSFKLSNEEFQGHIDAIAEHKKYGFSIVDYKSSKPFNEKELKNNLMQLYLYSIPVIKEYKRNPDSLIFYHFKEEDKKEYVFPFDEIELDKTIIFVENTIEKIKNYDGNFSPRCLNCNQVKDFYANNLCSHRYNCIYNI